MDHNKKEIIAQLEAQSKALQSWFLDQPIEKMEFAPEGAWTAGQHLLHLIKSTKPLELAIARVKRSSSPWPIPKSASDGEP